MEQEEISPFFYRCHLKAARKTQDEKSESAGRERAGQSSYSGDGEANGGGRDASAFSDREASGGFNGE